MGAPNLKKRLVSDLVAPFWRVVSRFKTLQQPRSLWPVHWSAGEKPLSNSQLAKLLALYEQNYVQVRMLIPHLQSLEKGVYWSRLDTCLDLRLQVLEVSPYTTTINLTYVFDGSTRGHVAPDLQIRVYHDARSAEALSGLVHGHRLTNRTVRSLLGSWHLNRFLYKWLRYCRFRGHRFNEAPKQAALLHSAAG